VDVILMDVQMPVLDGNQATHVIRHELNLTHLPIIALTAGVLLGERQRSIDSGMNDFVSKPFDPLTLIRKVRYLVEQARGKPIEMVLLDGPVERSSGGALMTSTDAGVVQQMFGEDLTLFKSVLAILLRDYADLALPTSPIDDPAARGEMIARVHKLKGGAGMLGATRVMQFAGAAEKALRDDRPAEAIEKILRKLAAAITTLRDEAQPFLNQQRDAAMRPSPALHPLTNPDAVDLQELLALLESQNLAAVDKATEYAPALAGLLGVATSERLREAIENLDFDRAAALLRH